MSLITASRQADGWRLRHLSSESIRVHPQNPWFVAAVIGEVILP
jgi:hypothetical protein